MNPNEQAWQRLVESARRAPADGRDASAPYGFAARVAARAMAADHPRVSLLGHFSLRALGAACLLTLAAGAFASPSLFRMLTAEAQPAAPALAPSEAEESAAPAAQPAAASSDDPVAELVDMVS